MEGLNGEIDALFRTLHLFIKRTGTVELVFRFNVVLSQLQQFHTQKQVKVSKDYSDENCFTEDGHLLGYSTV
jgi:hypothetical protein